MKEGLVVVLLRFKINKMKEYNIIPQEEETFCICSVLQTILNKDKIYVSQKDIANKLTPSKKGFYVDDNNIKNFLKEFGYDYDFYLRNTCPFNEPDSLLNEMFEHEGFVGLKNHIYLLAEFKDPKLILIDPLDASKKERDLYKLLKEMEKSKSGFFGLIKKTN